MAIYRKGQDDSGLRKRAAEQSSERNKVFKESKVDPALKSRSLGFRIGYEGANNPRVGDVSGPVSGAGIAEGRLFAKNRDNK
jgi:hypothetical protein